MKCDIIAQGVVDAVKEDGLKVLRLVVRLEGTNVEKGKEIIDNSGTERDQRHDFDDAAQEDREGCRRLSCRDAFSTITKIRLD